MDERTNDLIQLHADGALAGAERAELDAALTADRQARESMESFQTLVRELDALPRIDPPPLLVARVMRSVRASHAPAAATRPRADRRRVLLVAGYAAAAGLVLGLLAGPLLMRADRFRNAALPASVAGAMGTPEISSWDLVSRQSVATPAGNLVLSVRRDDGRYAVETACEGFNGATASISWDASRAAVLAVVRDRATTSIEVEPDRVRAVLADRDRLTLVLAAQGDPGVIHVDMNGTRLLSSDLSPENDRR